MISARYKLTSKLASPGPLEGRMGNGNLLNEYCQKSASWQIESTIVVSQWIQLQYNLTFYMIISNVKLDKESQRLATTIGAFTRWHVVNDLQFHNWTLITGALAWLTQEWYDFHTFDFGLSETVWNNNSPKALSDDFKHPFITSTIFCSLGPLEMIRNFLRSLPRFHITKDNNWLIKFPRWKRRKNFYPVTKRPERKQNNKRRRKKKKKEWKFTKTGNINFCYWIKLTYKYRLPKWPIQ